MQGLTTLNMLAICLFALLIWGIMIAVDEYLQRREKREETRKR
jgi:hypothetical protein